MASTGRHMMKRSERLRLERKLQASQRRRTEQKPTIDRRRGKVS
jgi:hypothetical protein